RDLANVDLIEAQYGGPVERQSLCEIDKRLLQPAKIVAVGFHVIGVDVGDHSEHRLEYQKRRIRFVGLGDQKLAAAEARVRVRRNQAASDDEGWIESALGKDAGDEAGRRGLTVRAGDGDALLQPHELAKHERPWHDRNICFARSDYFRIVG